MKIPPSQPVLPSKKKQHIFCVGPSLMFARTDGAGSFVQRSMRLFEALGGREVQRHDSHSDVLFLAKTHERVSET